MPAGVLSLESGAQGLEGEIPPLPDPLAQCLGVPPAVTALPTPQRSHRSGVGHEGDMPGQSFSSQR